MLIADATEDIIGKIEPSLPLLQNSAIDDTGKLTGIMILVNSLLRIFFVVAGLWAFLNIILAGFGFMTAGGDPKKVSAATAKIWQTFVGIIIMVSSFLIAAIIGILLFQDATAILKPSF